MELSVNTSDLQWELGKKVLINVPCINYNTLCSVHTRPPRVSPLVISKHALNNQGPLCNIEVDPMLLPSERKWIVGRIHYRHCSFDLNTTLTIKKNSSGTFFFILESLLSLQALHEKKKSCCQLKIGVACSVGESAKSLIGLWCRAQTGPWKWQCRIRHEMKVYEDAVCQNYQLKAVTRWQQGLSYQTSAVDAQCNIKWCVVVLEMVILGCVILC